MRALEKNMLVTIMFAFLTIVNNRQALNGLFNFDNCHCSQATEFLITLSGVNNM